MIALSLSYDTGIVGKPENIQPAGGFVGNKERLGGSFSVFPVDQSRNCQTEFLSQKRSLLSRSGGKAKRHSGSTNPGQHLVGAVCPNQSEIQSRDGRTVKRRFKDPVPGPGGISRKIRHGAEYRRY